MNLIKGETEINVYKQGDYQYTGIFVDFGLLYISNSNSVTGIIVSITDKHNVTRLRSCFLENTTIGPILD